MGSLSAFEEGVGCVLGGMVPVREAWQCFGGGGRRGDGEGRRAICLHGAGQRNVWKCTAALFCHGCALRCLSE